MKAVWIKPELVILYRGKPEERVLVTCKFPAAGPYPNSQGSCPNSGPHGCYERSSS
jgi:hypothetical protein